MKAIWARFKNKLFKALFEKAINDQINDARVDEARWHKGAAGGTGENYETDPFYLKLTPRFTEKDMDNVKRQYEKNPKFLFKGVERSKLIEIIEATGWVPAGFEDAAFRLGSLDELSTIQDACFKKYTLDPLGRSIVKNMQFFTIGKGVKVSCIDESANDWIKKFRDLNRMSSREKMMIRSAYIEGEYFLKYIKTKDNVYLRKVVPSRVRSVIFDEDDVEKVMGYLISSADGLNEYTVKDIGYDKLKEEFNLSLPKNVLDGLKEDTYIQMIKHGEEEYTRGHPPMYSVLRYLKHYEDWLVDRMRLNHERAKVVWIRSRSGSETTKPASPFSAPKGGIMLEESPAVRYRIESAKLESDDAKEDGLAVLYQIGAGVQQPLHILSQIASEAVYASIRKSDTPFAQMIESNQDMWKEEFERMYKFAMKLSGKFEGKKFKVPYYPEEARQEAMKIINEMIIDKKPDDDILKEARKILDRKGGKVMNVDLENLPITQVFPDIVSEDPLSITKALFLHRKMKICSSQTASEKAGYNWQEELAKMATDPKDDDEEDKGGTPGLDDSLGGPGDGGSGDPQI